MAKRKKELIMAARTVRMQIMDTEEEMQSSNAAQNQKIVLDMQLQQLLGEYGQAQEVIEMSKEAREAKKSGKGRPQHFIEKKVGKLALTAGVACWQSNKDVQEDRYILDIEVDTPGGQTVAGFAVLDGHSGSLCVDHIVEHLPANLAKFIGAMTKLTDDNITQAVHDAVIHTDEEFLKIARQHEVLDGSTMILCILYPHPEVENNETRSPGSCRLLTACVGDSRAVLCRAGTTPGAPQLVAVPLSEDHKPNRPDEKKRIEAKGGVVDFEGAWRCFIPGQARFGGQQILRWGLAVSRGLGDLLLKEPEKFGCPGVEPGGLIIAEPEIHIMDLEPSYDRFLMLASDGVWDVISNEDAVSICAAETDAQRAAQTLLRRTYAANSDDNITALVLTWRTEA